jgi:MFS family permease
MSTDIVAGSALVDRLAGTSGRRRRFGFWAVALVFLGVTALSSAPSPLYGLYAHRDGLSSLTVTGVYGVYAAGIVVSLLLFGHVSDWYGRRTVLVPAVVVALTATVLLSLWKSLPGLLVGRVLTGVALGASVTTATAYLSDVDLDATGGPSKKSQTVAIVSNIGGLAIGALVTGLIAQYVGDQLALPYLVIAALLAVGGIGLWLAPESRVLPAPRPRYRPQHFGLPERGRTEFVTAVLGIFVNFGVLGLIAGLASTLLAGPLRESSLSLAGLVLFITFATGCLVQVGTLKWSRVALMKFGTSAVLVALALLVGAAWVSPPNLALFLVGSAAVGAGTGAIFRGTFTIIISTAESNERAGALTTFFVAGYLGLSIPVVAAGFALEQFSPKIVLLAFAIVIGSAILAATPLLTARPPDSRN